MLEVFRDILKKLKYRGRYEFSMKVISKDFWNKTLISLCNDIFIKLNKKFDCPVFNLKVRSLQSKVLNEVGICSIFDHMCSCARSCDFGVKSYCCYCSPIKILDTDETSYFANFIVEPHDFDLRICNLFNKSIISFEVFDVTSHWLGKNIRCIKFEKIYSTKALFKYFVAIMF